MCLSLEIVDGVQLGKGEFGDVHEIKELVVPEQCTCYLCKVCSESDKTPLGPSKTHQSNKSSDGVKATDTSKGGVSKSSDGTTVFQISESRVSFAELTTITDCIGKTIHVMASEDKLPGSTIGSLFEDDLSEGERGGAAHGGDWIAKGIEREYRGFMKAHAMRDGIARYAIKRARSDLDKDSCTTAIIDLAAEAKFLSTLCHPNIVKLRGTISFPGHDDFGLVLDRMQLTLEDQILLWREEEKGGKGPLSRIGKVFKRKQIRQEHIDRLLALYDVARALKFLHKNSVLFRDLKSENVGCDVRGDFKIFDFGLARELKEKDLVKPPDGYKITGATGSRRYMAPENLLCLEYGLSADTYSFAILFWEVCSLKTPFSNFTSDKHFSEVVIKGKRPPLSPTLWLPTHLSLLMQECWSHTPSVRPTFQRIYQVLQSEINQVGEELGKDNIKDRSRHILDRSLTSSLGGGRSIVSKRRSRRIANAQKQGEVEA